VEEVGKEGRNLEKYSKSKNDFVIFSSYVGEVCGFLSTHEDIDEK
jgi:hypothetical protein